MPPQRPRPPQRPQPPQRDPNLPPPPFEIVEFPPQEPPSKSSPSGHDRYRKNYYHGAIELKLQVKTAVHVSTGIVALGTDVGQPEPLIKTMVRGTKQELMIPGSSLKGVVRSVYEAITNSTLGVVAKDDKQFIPPAYLPCGNNTQLCPASRVFGAMDWQGLVQFDDAHCDRTESVTGFMISPYGPNKQAYLRHGKAYGRKFYYHAIKAINDGNRGIATQQAGTNSWFNARIRFKNLTQAELGALFIALGQDTQFPFALKVGGGKPRGMGTMTVEVIALEAWQNCRDRYRSYSSTDAPRYTGASLTTQIAALTQAAKSQNLIKQPQLEHLSQILKFPTEYNAPTGNY